MGRLTLEQRMEAVILKGQGQSYNEIATHFQVSRLSIINLVKKHRESGSVKDAPRGGRKRSTTVCDDQRLVRASLQNCRLTSTDLRQVLVDNGVIITTRTVRNRLREAGLAGCRSETCEVKLESEESSVCAVSEDLITQSSLSENYLSGGCERESKIKCEDNNSLLQNIKQEYSPEPSFQIMDARTDVQVLLMDSKSVTEDIKQELSLKSSSASVVHSSSGLCNVERSGTSALGCVVKKEILQWEGEEGNFKEETKMNVIPLLRECSVVLRRIDITSTLKSVSGVTGSSGRQSSNKSDPAQRDKCFQCEKSFSRTDQVKPFTQCKHLSDGQFYCTACDKALSTADCLKKHIQRKHVDNRPHCCTQCQKSFCVKEDLVQHVNRVHGDKKYECDKCNYSAKYSQQLKSHISAVHLKEKPHKCPQCDSCFSRKRSITAHVRIVHNHEKLYECSVCNKKFSVRNNRDIHWRSVHCGVRSYSCDQCDCKFSKKFSLDKHQRTVHEGSEIVMRRI